VGSLLLSILADLIIEFGKFLKSLAVSAIPSVKPKDVPPMTPYRQKLKKLWDSCVVDIASSAEIAHAAATILSYKSRYETVATGTGVPWHIIGLFHMRESNFNFRTHLANGDPLFDSKGNGLKTIRVPAGLGPFKTWEEGAIAALKHQGFTDSSYHWDLVNALENIETWNGPGYKNLGVANPFLWAKTNNYVKGKYIADHVYDPNVVDKQLGCAAVLMALKTHGVDLNEV
jgi:lysozyme family protein